MNDAQAIVERVNESPDRALRENIALRHLLLGGCDANNEEEHHIIGVGANRFCMNCGEMAPRGKVKPWFDDERLQRAMDRLSVRALLEKQNG